MMYFYIKRGFDIILSFILIMILFPILLPIVILLLVTAEHHVFYKQERVGYKNQIFFIWKFATMLKNSPNMGTGDITLRKDYRVTIMGNFLRQTKINEIPQLINILKGEMSFVGPRPLMPRGFEDFPEHLKDKVYNVKPGLTGVGSIVFRDEELVLTESKLKPRDTYKNIIQPFKAEVEIWYQKNISFKTDFYIILITAYSIFFPKNNLVNLFFKDLPKRNF